MKSNEMMISAAIIYVFPLCMCPANGLDEQTRKKYKNETEVRRILAVQVSSPSVKFENEAVHPIIG